MGKALSWIEWVLGRIIQEDLLGILSLPAVLIVGLMVTVGVYTVCAVVVVWREDLAMNYDQAMALVRGALKVLGTFAATRGWMTSADAQTLATDLMALVGPTVVLVSFGWSLWAHSKKEKVKSVAAMPEVKSMVVVDQSLASAAGPKVISRGPL